MSRPFGQYRLQRLMGEGGMAQVWSAERSTSGGPMRCAVKIIKPSHAEQPRYREMFQREARLALALSGHGNVVSVFDVGDHEGRSYLAMELVDGVTLAELVHRVGRPWPVAEAVYVVAGVLRALCHIHGFAVDGKPQGIVHRDVTPHNVMVSARGEVKLMDFGIAQRADAEPCLGGALGKLAYVPREQVEGDPDQRSDLYAVGALLFEMLDGRRFRWHCADEDAYFLEIYRNRVPSLRRKDVPPAIVAVLSGLLQPDRIRRIATAAEALQGLEAWSGFRWAISELEALYAETLGPSASARAAEGGAARGHAPGRVPGRSNHDPRGARAKPASQGPAPARARASAAGRRPWDDSAPSAANDSGRSHRSATPTEPHPSASAPTHEDGAAVSRRRETVSAPAWSESSPSVVVTDELPAAPEGVPTRLLPAAEQNPEIAVEPMERLVTRRHPSAPVERDVPTARNSAEIAVTMPQPSRRAPWAEGTDPIAGRLVQPEPGAPIKRRRSGDGLADRTGSVAPRQRESAAAHRVASAGQPAPAPGVVAGEIVTDDGLGTLGAPVWRVSSR
jgi:serine/threonine protein kinase